MNPKESTTNPMAFDYGHDDCASTCCSSISNTVEISDVINVLDSQCDRIEELMSQLDRTCDRESAVRSQLSTLLSNLTVVQHVLGEHA